MDAESASALPALQSLPKVHHPTTLWSQDSKNVKLTIQLRGVQSISLRVTSKQMLFWVDHDGKRYVLLTTFFGDVIPANSKHEIFGGYITLRFEKAKAAEWPRLTAGTEKLPYLKFDGSDLEEEVSTFAEIQKLIGLPEKDSSDLYDSGLPEGVIDLDNSSSDEESGLRDLDNDNDDSSLHDSDEDAD